MEPVLRIGIDIGGTFTDFVVFHPESGTIKTFKLLSTPQNPADVVLQGLAQIINQHGLNNELPVNIIHGSTVATNTLLEHKGTRTALIATKGFRDVIQIGRQNRPDLYDLFTSAPPPLVSEEFRFEVMERIGSDGKIVTHMPPETLDSLDKTLNSNNIESVAISLLFAFANPIHEQEIAVYLRKAGYLVSVSSEILPEFREYERTCTTVVNAYVSPVLQKYLDTLEKSISSNATGNPRIVNFRVMQSNGGIIRIDEARRNGVRCILSGPAGGVIGARYIAKLARFHRIQTEKDESNYIRTYARPTVDE